MMVIWPEVTALASREAIELWLNSIVPSLLPFFIASGFLRKTGFADRVSPAVYPFIMAVLSGYPMGAKSAADYFREGRINGGQLKQILSYSMVTGPAFLIGTVGIEFLDSYKAGIILAASHYAAAAFSSLFWRSQDGFVRMMPERKNKEKDTYYNMLTDAILDSFRAIAIVLAYIILFMIITDLIQFSGLLHIAPGPSGPSFIKGIFEMTVGLSGVAAAPTGQMTKIVLSAFLVSFGGLSVLGQSMSMLEGCEITLWTLLKMKLLHGIFGGLFAFSLCAFML